jgi:histidyl-tRNA synthetase
MVKKFQAIRGMNDILPDSIAIWQKIEQKIRACSDLYNYNEIRFPLVENTILFKRTIGDNTDIVEKEMYTFNDLNGDSLSLRPEGTAGCVRACIENGLLHNKTQRVWYLGPMFRHERPQKGRYRQFNQFGIEAFGFDSIDIDVEVILFSKRLLDSLGLENSISLQLNTIGTLKERTFHKESLIAYFKKHSDMLDEESKSRLMRNPLRILDSKNKAMEPLIQNAPKLFDYLDKTSQERFILITEQLAALGIDYTVNPYLVRGLDYYTHTVFEWVTDKLGSQGTVCAGGRYDCLVEQLGGKSTPAVGFAMGLERIALLTQLINQSFATSRPPCVYFITVGEQANKAALPIAEELRNNGYSVELSCQHSSFKSQFKKADKTNAKIALILGDDEVQEKRISIKALRADMDQISVSIDELINTLKQLL